MTRKVTIALDVMGGDHGPRTVVPAALATLERDDSASFALVGLPEVLDRARRESKESYGSRLQYVPATEVVAMNDPPADALRRKRNSSLRIAIEQVKEGSADACISSGNTGALMATARYILKTLPGIDRPAIIAPVPTMKGPAFMLDLGANVGCTAEHLLQFALMGSIVAQDMLEIEGVSIGLLNIGQEDIKGDEIVREAGELLGRSDLNYVGFVEADAIFAGKANVVVSDGFVGNVALKTMEGVAGLIASYLQQEFRKSPLRKLQGAIASPALSALRSRLDARRYNGATLVGLNGIVIKSHGGADKLAFETAINMAIVEARKGVPVQIGKLIEDQAPECIPA